MNICILEVSKLSPSVDDDNDDSVTWNHYDEGQQPGHHEDKNKIQKFLEQFRYRDKKNFLFRIHYLPYFGMKSIQWWYIASSWWPGDGSSVETQTPLNKFVIFMYISNLYFLSHGKCVTNSWHFLTISKHWLFFPILVRKMKTRIIHLRIISIHL